MQTNSKSLARFLYNHNPFYLLSACCVLYGLHSAFGTRTAIPQNVWLLASSLCGYTLLLALTAYLVLRLGKVWEDVRSIVLVVILMLVAISVSFDEICSHVPATATQLLSFGLIFSILVSEGLIHSLKIKFPTSYRLPLYLTFALYFLYPLWVSPNLTEQSDLVTAWRVFSFPLAAAGVVLTLLPAVRQGSEKLRHNGTPWDWPWYPWPVFVFLAFGVCIRAYVLTLSFQAAKGLETSFSFYYLTPFFFALLVLISEISFVERSQSLQRFVLLATPALLLMSLPVGRGEAFDMFLASVVDSCGSPLWLAVIGVGIFYGYLWLRRVPQAESCCMVTMLLAIRIGPETIDLPTIADPQWWALALVGGIQSVRCLQLKSSLRCIMAGGCLLGACVVQSPDNWFTSHAYALPIHLLLGVAVAAGFAFHDRFAMFLRRVCPLVVVLFACCATVVGHALVSDDAVSSDLVRIVYVGSLTGIALGCWLATRDRLWRLALVMNSLCVMVVAMAWMYSGAQVVIPPRALAALGGGILCFLVATLISALKAGFGKQLRSWFDDVWRLPPQQLGKGQV